MLSYRKKYAKISLAPIPLKKGACSLLTAYSLSCSYSMLSALCPLLLKFRYREKHSTKYQVCKEQCPEDVECLGNRNAAAGRPPPMAISSLNFVSRPIHRKAMVNHHPLKPAVTPVTAFALASFIKKGNTMEAIMNPMTNLGNLNQISMRLGSAQQPVP